MDDNPNEWRIMYHGTKQHFVSSIVKNNLNLTNGNVCAKYDCQDESGNTVKVGIGFYFSNDFNVYVNQDMLDTLQLVINNLHLSLCQEQIPRKLDREEAI
ncbi:unnamed protein product [Paramecium octaurelia]|uniref:Uncharacterized protein n=1 Tax=Paramecium octaurelia TaxID=43137 RepID=A0A8S1YNP8_PAROT|nr:unnamed protein product [Paramecium octaurelia]